MRRNKGGDIKVRKASKKVRVIAGRLTRELGCKLSAKSLDKHKNHLDLHEKVLLQQRGDSNKFYSLHEPSVKCYTKGKKHKRFDLEAKLHFLLLKQQVLLLEH